MGSRNSQTTTYWIKDNIQVICGCFRGNLIEFENKVNETHKGNEYHKQYMNYISIVKTIMEMENK